MLFRIYEGLTKMIRKNKLFILQSLFYLVPPHQASVTDATDIQQRPPPPPPLSMMGAPPIVQSVQLASVSGHTPTPPLVSQTPQLPLSQHTSSLSSSILPVATIPLSIKHPPQELVSRNPPAPPPLTTRAPPPIAFVENDQTPSRVTPNVAGQTSVSSLPLAVSSSVGQPLQQSGKDGPSVQSLLQKLSALLTLTIYRIMFLVYG